jgi:hypothetical protein
VVRARGSDPPHYRSVPHAWGGSLGAPFHRGGLDGRGGGAHCRGDPGLQVFASRVRPVWTEASHMYREVAVRCSGGYPCLREAELSARRTAASSRRFLSSPWIRRPSMVDGSGIARSSIAAAARFWPTPLEAGGSLALASSVIRAGRPGPDDALLRLMLGLPTPARCFAGAALVVMLPRRAWPASRGFARAVCPDPRKDWDHS